MAYIQKVKPPTNQIVPFTIGQFHGGLNNRTSNVLQPHEASDLLNMSFYDGTILEKRKGSMYYNNKTWAQPLTMLDEFQPYNEPNRMIRCGNTLMSIDKEDGTEHWIALLGGVGADGENFQGKYFFTDGNMYRVFGKFPQASVSPYIQVNGTPIADYTSMQIVSTPAVYTPLDNTHTRGVTVYDYTNSTIWYEPCALEKADPYLGLSVVPAKPRYLASLKGRLYLSGSASDDDAVNMTQTANPYYIPVALGLQLPPNSDKIVGLATYDDAVVVGRRHDIHIITGTSLNPDLGQEIFAIRKLNTHTGFINNKCVNIAHNYLFFLGFDGNAYALSSARNDAKILATSLLSKQIDLRLPPFNFSQADIESGVSYFFDSVWYLSIKGYTLLYDYRVQAWTLWDGLNIRSFYSINGELIWGNDTGCVCKHSVDYLDQGKPFLAYWESSNLDMGEPTYFKQFRDSYIVAHTFKGYNSDIRMGFELDYADINGSLLVESQVARWGISKFGDKYTVREINASLPFSIGRRARTLKVRISNGYKYKGDKFDLTELNALLGARVDDLYYVTTLSSYYVYRGNNVWEALETTQINQPMRVYQINGEYELRGKR